MLVGNICTKVLLRDMVPEGSKFERRSDERFIASSTSTETHLSTSTDPVMELLCRKCDAVGHRWPGNPRRHE
jgi:hypothetical protein